MCRHRQFTPQGAVSALYLLAFFISVRFAKMAEIAPDIGDASHGAAGWFH
jgi:hypothetical protein